MADQHERDEPGPSPNADEALDPTIVPSDPSDAKMDATLHEALPSTGQLGSTLQQSASDPPVSGPRPPWATPPRIFGRYQIEQKLGQGNMGAVYLARDSQLDREVALKIPFFDDNSGEEIIQRFYREARAMATR